MAQSARTFASTFGVPEEAVRAELVRVAGPDAHVMLDGAGADSREACFALTDRGRALIAATGFTSS